MWRIESSTDQNLWKSNVFSYHSATGTISCSGWFPTTWSTIKNSTGGSRLLIGSILGCFTNPGKKNPLYSFL